MMRSNSMQVVIVASLAAAALLGLQGCGGGSSPPPSPVPPTPPTCMSSDVYDVAGKGAEEGQVVYFAFSQKSCADDLLKVTSSQESLNALNLVAEALGSVPSKEPAVDAALLEAVKPLCVASCPKSLVECKIASDNTECTPSKKAGYVNLFEYVCRKAGGEGGGNGGGTDCTSSANLYKFPSVDAKTGELAGDQVIFLKFGVEECARDLSTFMSSDTLASALLAVVIGLIKKDEPEVPAALHASFKPLCSAKCAQNLLQCKVGQTGDACEQVQHTGYVELFGYICVHVNKGSGVTV